MKKRSSHELPVPSNSSKSPSGFRVGVFHHHRLRLALQGAHPAVYATGFRYAERAFDDALDCAGRAVPLAKRTADALGLVDMHAHYPPVPGQAICTPQGRSRNTVRNPCTFPRLWQSNICRPRAVPTPRRKDRCARRIRSQRIFPYRYDTPFSPPSHTSRHKPLEIFYHAARALSSSDFRPRTTPLHFILHSRF